MRVTNTTRRKARRGRAKARRAWFLFRRGHIELNRAALLKIKRTLEKHHSRDFHFLAQIQAAMNFEPDQNTEYFPWKCPCGRINKKWATTCAICYGPWSAGTRHRTEPKSYDWDEWHGSAWDGWEEGGSRSASRSTHQYASRSPKPRNQQKPVPKNKGKSKGKGKKGKDSAQEKASPFQKEEQGYAPWPTLDSSKFVPSSTLVPNPFAAMSMASIVGPSSGEQEWVEHLRRAYPDPSTMPEETKLLIAKADQESGRMGIKNLHQATKYLGKAKKHLTEVTDQRRSHRALWMSHISAGIQLWEKQLDDYRKHQAALTEQAARTRTEITATNRLIQQLSSQAAGGPAPSTPQTAVEVEDAAEESADKEEEIMRQHLQGVLRSCANSLGLDLETPKTAIEVPEDDGCEGEEAEKKSKRPRSLEPFATTPSSKS